MTFDEALDKLEQAVRDESAWDPPPAGVTDARAQVVLGHAAFVMALTAARARIAGLEADLEAVILERDSLVAGRFATATAAAYRERDEARADLERARTCNRAHERVNRELGLALATHPMASP